MSGSMCYKQARRHRRTARARRCARRRRRGYDSRRCGADGGSPNDVRLTTVDGVVLSTFARRRASERARTCRAVIFRCVVRAPALDGIDPLARARSLAARTSREIFKVRGQRRARVRPPLPLPSPSSAPPAVICSPIAVAATVGGNAATAAVAADAAEISARTLARARAACNGRASASNGHPPARMPPPPPPPPPPPRYHRDAAASFAAHTSPSPPPSPPPSSASARVARGAQP